MSEDSGWLTGGFVTDCGVVSSMVSIYATEVVMRPPEGCSLRALFRSGS